MTTDKAPIAFTNARLLDPSTGRDETGNLLIDEGQIAAIGADAKLPESGRIINCKGKLLIPGIVDLRAHSVDMASAARGGITTLALQPDQNTVIDNDAAIERIIAKARDAGGVRVLPMGAATKKLAGAEMAELGLMQASGAIAFTDDRRAIADANLMRRLLEYAKHFGALVVQFPQEPSLAADGIVHEGPTATRIGLKGIPAAAEAIQIERDLRLAELTGGRLHFSMLSSRLGVEAIRRGKAMGLEISAATSPAYLHFNDNALEGFRTFAKLSPPLRSEEDRLSLIEGLADGTIDCLVSDHDPRAEDGKRLPFAQAAVGAVGFETLLPIGLSHVQAGRVDLMRLIDALSHRPAKLLGLNAGTLQPGTPADLCLIDTGKPNFIQRKKLVSTMKNTPFDTLPIQGDVMLTMCGGTITYQQDKL